MDTANLDIEQTEVFRLAPSAFMVLESADGSARARIDIYEARRLIETAFKKPDESSRWALVKEWLSKKLGVPIEQIAESTALEFNDLICKRVADLNKERSIKVSGTAALPTSMQESPVTTKIGL